MQRTEVRGWVVIEKTRGIVGRHVYKHKRKALDAMDIEHRNECFEKGPDEAGDYSVARATIRLD